MLELQCTLRDSDLFQARKRTLTRETYSAVFEQSRNGIGTTCASANFLAAILSTADGATVMQETGLVDASMRVHVLPLHRAVNVHPTGRRREERRGCNFGLELPGNYSPARGHEPAKNSGLVPRAAPALKNRAGARGTYLQPSYGQTMPTDYRSRWKNGR
jgi:hypothetical protein